MLRGLKSDLTVKDLSLVSPQILSLKDDVIILFTGWKIGEISIMRQLVITF